MTPLSINFDIIRGVFDALRAMEKVTRPLGHDADTPVRDNEIPQVMNLDDVVAQLAQLTYFVEDVRNLLASRVSREGYLGPYSPPPEHFAGAAASLADGRLSGDLPHEPQKPSVREDRQQTSTPADPQPNSSAAPTLPADTSAGAGDPPTAPAAIPAAVALISRWRERADKIPAEPAYALRFAADELADALFNK